MENQENNAVVKNRDMGNTFMLLFILINLAAQIIIALILYLPQYLPQNLSLDSSRQSLLIDSPWFTAVTQVACFIFPVLLILAIKRRNKAHVKMYRPHMIGFTNFILILLISVLIQPILMLVSGLMTLAFPNPINALLSNFQSVPLYVTLIVFALTPAICEELVFRGFILAQYENSNFKKVMFVNGLFFGMIHFSAQQFLYAFIIGILLACFVFHTRSLLSSMLAHFTINATQLVLRHFIVSVDQALPDTQTATDTELTLPSLAPFLVLSLFILPLIIILYCHFVFHNRKRNAIKENKAAEITNAIESKNTAETPNARTDARTGAIDSNLAETPNARTDARTGVIDSNLAETPNARTDARTDARTRVIDLYFWIIVAIYALVIFSIEILPRVIA